MKRIDIKQLLTQEPIDTVVVVKGWVKAFRSRRFIQINDGSTLKNIQAVVDFESMDEQLLQRITIGASVSVTGRVVASQGRGQRIEVEVSTVDILGDADPIAVSKTILQPKKHSPEILRDQAHLRFRTNLFGAVFRVRHAVAYAIHHYFNARGYHYIHTPVITSSDAEGAGELFRVSALDPRRPPLTEAGTVDWEADFFGRETYLTVSGQLEAELAALALGKVYTFGPTFRAENSNTARHLAEFWMVEPEVAFADLVDNVDLAEDFLHFICRYVMENNAEDLQFLNDREEKENSQKPKSQRSERSLLDRLRFVIDHDFERTTYTQAIELLKQSKPYKKGTFQFPVEWGTDLQAEHERYLVEKHFQKPVVITDYPASFKAFYMRMNEDGKTVAAMDILFPGIGEIVGGSQREERYDVLQRKLESCNIPKDKLWWYLETRRFGTAPHAGFGLGFERMVMFVTGMANIRDVIPFPRTPKKAAF